MLDLFPNWEELPRQVMVRCHSNGFLSSVIRTTMDDRRVMHDGYLNTYSFTKDGKKITLAPLAPS